MFDLYSVELLFSGKGMCGQASKGGSVGQKSAHGGGGRRARFGGGYAFVEVGRD